MVLDKRADIFMNLNGAVDEIELPVKDDAVYVYNSWTDSIPIVIHGNGPAKVCLVSSELDLHSSSLVYRKV